MGGGGGGAGVHDASIRMMEIKAEELLHFKEGRLFLSLSANMRTLLPRLDGNLCVRRLFTSL